VVRKLARRVLVACAVLALCASLGCEAVQTRTIADDTRKLAVVDAGSIDDIIREVIQECRLALIDAGRIPSGGAPAVIDVCTVTPFYEGCPLRVCVARLAERVAPQCPPRDAGIETSDSRFCDAVIWPFLPDNR
jgi:hypothetical protein